MDSYFGPKATKLHPLIPTSTVGTSLHVMLLLSSAHFCFVLRRLDCNKDTSGMKTLCFVPLVSVLRRFGCNMAQLLEGHKSQVSLN